MRFHRLAVAVPVAIVFAAGCGARSSGDAVECVSDSECAAVAHARCGANGVCEALCSSSSECGSEEVCMTGACVALRNSGAATSNGSAEAGDCFALLDGTPISDLSELSAVSASLGTDPIVVGVMGDFVEGKGHYFTDGIAANGIAAALNDINAQALFGGRKMVALMCNQEHPAATAAHLVAVGAKAIVGPTIERVSREIAPTLAAAKVPIVSSWLVGSSAADGAEMNGLLWLPAPTREATMVPLQAKLSEMEGEFLTENAGKSRNMKVAVVIDDAATDGEYGRYRELVSSLRFNGESAARNELSAACSAGAMLGCFRTVSTAVNPSDSAAGAKTNAAVAAELYEFSPDLIIPIGDVTMMNSLPPVVEKSAFAASVVKPRWLVPFNLFEFGAFKNIGTYVDSTGPIPPLAIPDSALVRVRGIRAFSGTNFYGDTRPVARAYEDMSLVFYAALKAWVGAQSDGRTDFSSEELAAAIPNVTKSTSSTRVLSALIDPRGGAGTDALLAGQTIQVRGILSAFDFDPSTGKVPGRWEAWQVNATGTDRATYAGTDYTYEVYSYGGRDPGGNCFDPVDSTFTSAMCEALLSQ